MKKIMAAILALCIAGGALPTLGTFKSESVITASAEEEERVYDTRAYLTYYSSAQESFTTKDFGEEEHTEVTVGYVTYYVFEDEAFVYRCSEDAEGEIEILSEVNGMPVVAICNGAFGNGYSVFINGIGAGGWAGTNVTSVIIPDSVIVIGRMAFAHCEKLESVRLPEKISYLNGEIFNNCKSLKSLDIPDSVVYICDWVVDQCDSLEYVIVPAAAAWFEEGALYPGAASMENFTLYCYDGSPAQEIQYNDLTKKIMGDVDDTDSVDGRDASTVLTHYALTSTGKSGIITGESALIRADYDRNGVIDARDASAILTYYAEQSVNNG